MWKQNKNHETLAKWKNSVRNITVITALMLVLCIFPQICKSDPYDITKGTPFEFDSVYGRFPALYEIDESHNLCVYQGSDNDGYAVVLTVDTNAGTITQETPIEFETNYAEFPVLSQIDATHYLCIYKGSDYSGHPTYYDSWSVILTVDTTDWTITAETPFELYIDYMYYALDLYKIDSTHYLCSYTGTDYDDDWSVYDGWAVVLSVDTGDWSITVGTPFEFETIMAASPVLSQIDNSHYLCVYQGPDEDGWSTVLTVNTTNWTITAGTPFEFETTMAASPVLSPLDSTHYLCVYTGTDYDGWSVVLTIDTSDWSIQAGTLFEFEANFGIYPALSKIDDTHCICAYTGSTGNGLAVVLSVDNGDWTITASTPFEFETLWLEYTVLSQIDDSHYLCAYEGPDEDGWSVILNVELPPAASCANINVWLEGAYSTDDDSMRTTINDSIPLTSPYHDAITVTSIPGNVVDWVSIELRSDTTAASIVTQRSMFLQSDGDIVNAEDVETAPEFPEISPGDYYVVVCHRNHLAIMSKTAQTFKAKGDTPYTDIDLTVLSNVYGTGGIKELETGVYGMYAGETNDSGIITNADKSAIIANLNLAGYYKADTNFSGIVTNADKSFIIENTNKASEVPE